MQRGIPTMARSGRKTVTCAVSYMQSSTAYFFLRQTGRQAGRWAGNDTIFLNYVTLSSSKGLYLMRGKENLLASQFAVCLIFFLLFGSKSLVCCLVGKSFSSMQIQYRSNVS